MSTSLRTCSADTARPCSSRYGQVKLLLFNLGFGVFLGLAAELLQLFEFLLGSDDGRLPW